MTRQRWETLSSWHNAWLTADPVERARLRQQLAQDQPELVDAAERLIADPSSLQGFLETPAFVLAANELAATYAVRGETDPSHRIHASRTWWMAGALALAILAGAIGWHLRPTPVPSRPERPVVRFTVPLPSGLDLLSVPTVSPDGQRIAFVGGNASRSRLMVRDLGAENPTAIEGTDAATSPFWSPDGEWIGFSAGGRLMKVARAGGAPAVIDGAVGSWGGAWGPSGVFVFQPAVRNAGLLRVPDGGGRSEPASILNDAAGDVSHRFPVMLPDGLSFLYWLVSNDAERQGMYVARLDRPAAPASRRLGPHDHQGTYVALADGTGLLLWAVGGRIEVRRFDPVLMQVGDAQTLDIAPVPATQTSPAMLSATADVLAYATAGHESSPPHEIGIVIGWRRLVQP